MSLARILIATTVLGALIHPAVALAQAPPSSSLIEVSRGGLGIRDGAPALIYTLTSTTRDPIWALVEVNAADGARKCEWFARLATRQAYRFECPLSDATPGQKYASRLRVWKDAKLEDRELLYEPTLDVTAAALAEAEKAPPLTDKTTVVPEGLQEAAELPVPSTFKPTWYRRVDRGFSLRAYENSGDLTVDADAVTFVDGKKTVKVPYAQIISVRWEPLPNDIANHWVVVKFTNEEGKPDGVAFRDGGQLGRRQGTGMIYVTLHRAAKK